MAEFWDLHTNSNHRVSLSGRRASITPHCRLTFANRLSGITRYSEDDFLYKWTGVMGGIAKERTSGLKGVRFERSRFAQRLS